jgi:uncharacterized oligopeptide transporter (OPT) family protein
MCLTCLFLSSAQFSFFTASWGKSIVLAVFVVILGFVFSAVASYMAGLVGSSNNPVSGVTISTVLIISLIIRGMFGRESEVGAPAAVLVGNIVCSAAAIGGDNMQDLKAGHLLGSTPWKQQIMQIVGVTASALVMAPTLEVLRVAYGFGNGDGQLAAPQAKLVADVSNGVIRGGLPWSYLGVGIAIGAVVIVIDLWLESRKSEFRIPILAFAVGFYLPMDVGSAIFIGSLVPWFLGIEDTEAASPGLMYSAGVITGAGLMGIIIAFVIVFYGIIAEPDTDDSNPLKVSTNVDEATNTVRFRPETALYFVCVPTRSVYISACVFVLYPGCGFDFFRFSSTFRLSFFSQVFSLLQLGVLLGGMFYFSAIEDASFKKHDEEADFAYKAGV